MRLCRLWMLAAIGLLAEGIGLATTGRAEVAWRHGGTNRAAREESASDDRRGRPKRYLIVGECGSQRIGGVTTVSPALVQRAVESGHTHLVFTWRAAESANGKKSDAIYERITLAGVQPVIRPMDDGALAPERLPGCATRADGTRLTPEQGGEQAARSDGSAADPARGIAKGGGGERLRRTVARAVERYPKAKIVRLDLDRPDATVVGHVAEVVRGLGCRLMLHSRTDDLAIWNACRASVDIASVVLPAAPPDDPARQRRFDDHLESLRAALGPDVVVIGRPVTRPQVGGPTSHIRKARDWKTTLLRMAAAGYRGVDMPAAPALGRPGRLYVSRATRILCVFEDLLWHGTRHDKLASASLGEGNVLVLTRGTERLVLLFNPTDRKRTVELANHELGRKARTRYVAQTYEARRPAPHPNKMFVTVPAHDVAVVHVRRRAPGPLE